MRCEDSAGFESSSFSHFLLLWLLFLSVLSILVSLSTPFLFFSYSLFSFSPTNFSFLHWVNGNVISLIFITISSFLYFLPVLYLLFHSLFSVPYLPPASHLAGRRWILISYFPYYHFLYYLLAYHSSYSFISTSPPFLHKQVRIISCFPSSVF